MTAKDYLKQYRQAVADAEKLREEYKEQTAQAESIRSALGGDGMPRSGEVSKRVEADAIRLAEKAEELLQAEVEALRIRQEIERTVRKVKGFQGDVLRERYINLQGDKLQRWEDVADAVGYSLRRTHELHLEGLDQVELLLSKQFPH